MIGERVEIRLPAGLLTAIDAEAAELGVPRSAMIRMALESVYDVEP